MNMMCKNRKDFLRLNLMAIVLLFATLSCSANPVTKLTMQNSAINQTSSSEFTLPVSLPQGQGVFENCSLVQNPDCIDHLKQIAAAGFKLVLNYGQLYATDGQELDYAEEAHQLGIKVIWAMNNPAFWNGANLLQTYRNLGYSCTCSTNTDFIHYVVNLVKNLPATWGYLVGEDVRDHDSMKTFADLVKQFDPHHPRLAISQEDSTSGGSYIKPYVDTADVLGSAVFPIGSPASVSTIATVGNVAHSLQSTADANSKQAVLVLQAYSVAQYGSCSPSPGCARFPTVDEMRQMLKLALKGARPQLILWYSYFDILRSDDPSRYWANLIKAAGVNPVTSV